MWKEYSRNSMFLLSFMMKLSLRLDINEWCLNEYRISIIFIFSWSQWIHHHL